MNSNETRPSECFTVITENGRPVLSLNLPEGAPLLEEIGKSNEYDYDVPDAKITIPIKPVIRALETLRAEPNTFRHIGVEVNVASVGYEGKISLEYLNVYAHYNEYYNLWNYSFFLFWTNDWSSTEYFLDVTYFISKLIGGFDNIVEDLAKLEAGG